MANVTYTPRVKVEITTGDASSRPITLKRILTLQSSLTLAPSTGKCQMIVSDIDGTYAQTFKPNDLVTVYISSPDDPTLSQPSWSGLIDECYAYIDPSSQYGPACQIKCSTYWKLFETTAVPLYYFLTGAYPKANSTITDLISTALQDIFKNTGINIPFDFEPFVVSSSIPPWTVPDDFIDPEYQSWASYLVGTVLVNGIEVFFDETGKLIVRSPKFAENVSSLRIPDQDVFSRVSGVSDVGLIDNVVISFGAVETKAGAAVSPATGVGTAGQLPPEITNLSRLGIRFQSQSIPWIQDLATAKRYAALVRALGLSNVSSCQSSLALHGDLSIGTTVSLLGAKKRYYVSTIQHQWMFGQEAQTLAFFTFGMDFGAPWDPHLLDQAGFTTLPDYSGGAPSQLVQNGRVGPPTGVGTDYSVLLTTPTLSIYDIQRILSSRGSPFTGLAQHIWSMSQTSKIDPSFALAVWTIETQLGTDGSNGSIGHNPGNRGPGYTYPTWQAGIDDWYSFMVNDYVGTVGSSGQALVTVNAIAGKYIPDTQQNPTQMEDWEKSVSSLMYQYRTQFANLVAPVIVQPVGSGLQPSGWPTPTGVRNIIQSFGCTSSTNEPRPPKQPGYPTCAHFHYGIDISGAELTPLYATLGGLLNIGYKNPYQTYGINANGDYGNLITITNGPWIVKFGHTADPSVKPSPQGISDGVRVESGQLIGWMDTTGNAGGVCHVHYEIDYHDGDQPQDPMVFMTS